MNEPRHNMLESTARRGDEQDTGMAYNGGGSQAAGEGKAVMDKTCCNHPRIGYRTLVEGRRGMHLPEYNKFCPLPVKHLMGDIIAIVFLRSLPTQTSGSRFRAYP